MAQKGLSMRKIREVLRLRALGLSQQEIARSSPSHRTERRIHAQGAGGPIQNGGPAMSTGTRLQLKQPAGWFAAGREVASALTLLCATFRNSARRLWSAFVPRSVK